MRLPGFCLLFLTGLSVCVGASHAQTLPPIQILNPAANRTLATLPVPVEIRFNAPVASSSFKAILNSQDVTARFTADSQGAAGALSLRDGLRVGGSNQLKILSKDRITGQNYSAVRSFSLQSVPASSVSGSISPSGGSLDLSGIASVLFPQGAVERGQAVELAATTEVLDDLLFADTAHLFQPGPRPIYAVRVVMETAPAQPITLSLAVPDAFRASLPADSEIRVFSRNFWSDEDEELDTFEILDARFPANATSVTFALEPYAFTSETRSDGRFEAVLMLSSTPTAASTSSTQSLNSPPGGAEIAVPLPPDALPGGDGFLVSHAFAAAADRCDGASLGPPLNGELEVRSPFGPRDPSIGSGGFHRGTDFRAATGTPVLAVSDGTIEVVARQINPQTGKGWGNYVVLKHPDGAITLYAHLQAASVIKGTRVTRGTVIGKSGVSGAPGQPHLHLEYAPDGKFSNKSSKVDPFPCIGANVEGSITVRDNGSLADDAFEVTIEGRVVCTTAIGASNNCAIGNLRPGTATLGIKAIVAPDNVGTFEVSLGDGLTFQDGSTSRSGTLPQGGSTAFAITIPEP